MDQVLCYIICFLAFISRGARWLGERGIGSFERWEPGKKIKILLVLSQLLFQPGLETSHDGYRQRHDQACG